MAGCQSFLFVLAIVTGGVLILVNVMLEAYERAIGNVLPDGVECAVILAGLVVGLVIFARHRQQQERLLDRLAGGEPVTVTVKAGLEGGIDFVGSDLFTVVTVRPMARSAEVWAGRLPILNSEHDTSALQSNLIYQVVVRKSAGTVAEYLASAGGQMMLGRVCDGQVYYDDQFVLDEIGQEALDELKKALE